MINDTRPGRHPIHDLRDPEPRAARRADGEVQAVKRLTNNQRRALIEATIEPLVAFRRGFARSKAGPFFDLRTIKPLIDTGVLRAFHPERGKRGLQITARAA